MNGRWDIDSKCYGCSLEEVCDGNHCILDEEEIQRSGADENIDFG